MNKKLEAFELEINQLLRAENEQLKKTNYSALSSEEQRLFADRKKQIGEKCFTYYQKTKNKEKYSLNANHYLFIAYETNHLKATEFFTKALLRASNANVSEKQRQEDETQNSFLYGLAYLTGIGRPANRGIAIQLLSIAAKAQNEKALSLLGLMYHKGRGVRRNQKKALKCFAEAASLGYPPALSYWGLMKDQQRKTRSAFGKYLAAAERGSDVGQYKVAMKYLYFKPERDVRKAHFWLLAAVLQDNRNAMEELAQLYQNQSPPLSKNAGRLYRKAFDAGSPLAYERLREENNPYFQYHACMIGSHFADIAALLLTSPQLLRELTLDMQRHSDKAETFDHIEKILGHIAAMSVESKIVRSFHLNKIYLRIFLDLHTNLVFYKDIQPPLSAQILKMMRICLEKGNFESIENHKIKPFVKAIVEAWHLANSSNTADQFIHVAGDVLKLVIPHLIFDKQHPLGPDLTRESFTLLLKYFIGYDYEVIPGKANFKNLKQFLVICSNDTDAIDYPNIDRQMPGVFEIIDAQIYANILDDLYAHVLNSDSPSLQKMESFLKTNWIEVELKNQANPRSLMHKLIHDAGIRWEQAHNNPNSLFGIRDSNVQKIFKYLQTSNFEALKTVISAEASSVQNVLSPTPDGHTDFSFLT